MSSHHGDEAVALEYERRLLGLLLRENAPTRVAENLLQRLSGYQFRSGEHQVLFDCVARLRGGALRNLVSDFNSRFLEHLVEHLVRAGFPDLDLAGFQNSPALNPHDAAALCDSLLLRR